MKVYKINEIFYSLQGEGRNTGRAAVFVRFSGCNLSCPFCDTKHQDGEMLTEDDIAERVGEFPRGLLVMTGGEPALYINKGIVARLKEMGFEVAIETNGTRPLPENIDWVTLSPKDMFVKGGEVVLKECDELKVVFTGLGSLETLTSLTTLTTLETLESLESLETLKSLSRYDNIKAKYRYLQPCDTGDAAKNKAVTQQCVEYIKQHPQWAISLQLHKILDIR